MLIRFICKSSVVLYPAIRRIKNRKHSRRLSTLSHLDTASQNLVVPTGSHTHRNKHERTIKSVEHLHSLNTKLTLSIVSRRYRKQRSPRSKLNSRTISLDAQSFADE
jgi:hypothetical protein